MGVAVDDRVAPELGGVPETLLWTLYHRALEARRPDAVLADPKAVELVDRIEYPFEQRFGTGGLSQLQALRARCFDREVRRFLAGHPDGTVVALGEGLETQFWRVDNGRVTWLSVDLPESISLRDELLPGSPRRRGLACSALDRRWLDEVDPSRGVLVTAQGLLMYLARADVDALLTSCAQRLPAAHLVFDAIPRWLVAQSQRGALKGGGDYRPPPWQWGIDAREERRLAQLHPCIDDLRALPAPRGRGAVHGLVLPLASRVPALRRRMLSVFRARFASTAPAPAPAG